MATNKLRSRTRDVQIHAAVTVMPNVNNAAMIGERDVELCQFAVQLDAKHMPVTEKQVQIAFSALAHQCIEQMQKAGLLR